MKKPVIVVDDRDDWKPYASGPTVIAAADYLSGRLTPPSDARIINLCTDTSYLSSGYYVSLLAEARGKRVLPSVRTVLELGGQRVNNQRLAMRCPSTLRNGCLPDEITIHFGRCADPRFASIASMVFTRCQAPIIHAAIHRNRDQLIIDQLRPGRLDELDDAEETVFAEALDHFNRRVWRHPAQRGQRYDLAILVDPDEALPPSNRQAIRLFERAARSVGFDPEIITVDDEHRLLEFDALLIRCTTAIDHPTYQLAHRANREGMAVIDHPDAILRCCNKVFLHDLLHTNHIDMPASALVLREPSPPYEQLITELGLPLVLKIPDGSFSRGVFKVESIEELAKRCDTLLSESAVIIAQAFVPTAYDWRIGVLDGRPLYACRYHMAHNHWQIVNHQSGKGTGRFGHHECLPLAQVPGTILRTAVKAAKLIGSGLFGVDLKEIDGQALVIEVNDNPSIDAGVEDEILGEELYRQICAHLLASVQSRGRS